MCTVAISGRVTGGWGQCVGGAFPRSAPVVTVGRCLLQPGGCTLRDKPAGFPRKLLLYSFLSLAVARSRICHTENASSGKLVCVAQKTTLCPGQGARRPAVRAFGSSLTCDPAGQFPPGQRRSPPPQASSCLRSRWSSHTWSRGARFPQQAASLCQGRLVSLEGGLVWLLSFQREKETEACRHP